MATFVSGTTGTALPLMQGFESSSSLPSGWGIKNPDNDAAWQVVTTVAHTGTNCIGFDNFDGDGNTDMTGRKDWFYTATYDFSSTTSAAMSFDVAYATMTYSGVIYGDTLTVLYSTDCGTTWTQAYKKAGATLATAPTTTNSSTGWVPSSTQWRTDNISLATLSGQSSVMFAFENSSDWGEWIYLDNINITTSSATGISSHATNGVINVYPNPAHDNLFINVSENTNALSVINIMGQTVLPEQRIVATQQVHTIDIANLADGIYFMKVTSTDNQPKIIRFIKN